MARRETALKAARTQVELARAQAGVQAGVQANLAVYSMLVADAPGVVTAVDAEPGAVLAADAPCRRTLREVAAATDLVTRTSLVKADVGTTALRLGQTASMLMDAPGVAGVIKLPRPAVFEAGGVPRVWLVNRQTMPTVRRFRPIVLPAAAAGLAMIPLTRSVSWGPMAVAIMGGLIAATALTLLALPAMYAARFRVNWPALADTGAAAG